MAERQWSDRLFLAIAHPVRRRILELTLEHGELSVTDLHAHFELTLPSLSGHLKTLRDAGLLADRKAGRHVFYRLTPEPLLEVTAWMTAFEATWRNHFDQLGSYLATHHSPPGHTDPRNSTRQP